MELIDTPQVLEQISLPARATLLGVGARAADGRASVWLMIGAIALMVWLNIVRVDEGD
jgi:hypothetical protein